MYIETQEWRHSLFSIILCIIIILVVSIYFYLYTGYLLVLVYSSAGAEIFTQFPVLYVIVLPRLQGIYGCKLPECEGAARGRGLFSTINAIATVVELFYIH